MAALLLTDTLCWMVLLAHGLTAELRGCDRKRFSSAAKISIPNHQKLKTMEKRSLDQKLRSRNSDARHGKIESTAVAESRKGQTGIDGGTGICYQWREKGSVRKETVAVSATRPKIVCKNQNALPPHLPSQSFYEVEVLSVKRSIRGKSNHGSIARQPCRYLV